MIEKNTEMEIHWSIMGFVDLIKQVGFIPAMELLANKIKITQEEKELLIKIFNDQTRF